MGILATLLVSQVNASFQGPNGDYPAVLEALTGATAPEAVWHPAPERHSIAEIVLHLAEQRVFLTRSLHGEPVQPEPWTKVVNEQACLPAVAQLHQEHAKLVDALSRLDDDLLSRPSSLPNMQHRNRCLGDVLLSGTSAHDAYHAGQIRYLRALYAGQS